MSVCACWCFGLSIILLETASHRLCHTLCTFFLRHLLYDDVTLIITQTHIYTQQKRVMTLVKFSGDWQAHSLAYCILIIKKNTYRNWNQDRNKWWHLWWSLHWLKKKYIWRHDLRIYTECPLLLLFHKLEVRLSINDLAVVIRRKQQCTCCSNRPKSLCLQLSNFKHDLQCQVPNRTFSMT